MDSPAVGRAPPGFSMDIEQETDPFARRATLQRSPQNCLQTTLCEGKENYEPISLCDAIAKMGSILEGLSATIFLKGQRHINQLLKDEITNLVSIQKRAETLCALASNQVETTRASKSTQTSTKNNEQSATQSDPRKNTPKRPRESLSGNRKTPPKKAKGAARPSTGAILPQAATGATVTEQTKPKGNVWTKVQNPQSRRARQDAIVLTGKGCTYADLLKSVRSDPTLQHLSGDVQAIRKTASGDLLLRLSKARVHSTKEVEDAVGKALGDRAAVKSLADTAEVVIKDLDELATIEEVQKAVESALEQPGVSVRAIRKTVHGMQIAFLSLPLALARKLSAQSKIRIGWSVCRIQMQMRPKRCFKCFEFGHIVANCKSKIDHSGKCFNCGLPGHTAKGCTKAPNCLLCAREAASGSSHQADHAAGSFKCPFFKEALKNCKC